MPIDTTSNFLRSIALRTDAADSSETSCSPLRPPNRIPTRTFLAMALFHTIGALEASFRWTFQGLAAALNQLRKPQRVGSHRIFFPNAEQASSTARSSV